MYYTTLNKIREHRPCYGGWGTLLRYLGKTGPDDEPVSLLTIPFRALFCVEEDA